MICRERKIAEASSSLASTDMCAMQPVIDRAAYASEAMALKQHPGCTGATPTQCPAYSVTASLPSGVESSPQSVVQSAQHLRAGLSDPFVLQWSPACRQSTDRDVEGLRAQTWCGSVYEPLYIPASGLPTPPSLSACPAGQTTCEQCLGCSRQQSAVLTAHHHRVRRLSHLFLQRLAHHG